MNCEGKHLWIVILNEASYCGLVRCFYGLLLFSGKQAPKILPALFSLVCTQDISAPMPKCFMDILAPRKTPQHQATVSTAVPAFNVIVHTGWLVKHWPSRCWPGGQVNPVLYSRCCTKSRSSDVGNWLFDKKGKWSKWVQWSSYSRDINTPVSQWSLCDNCHCSMRVWRLSMGQGACGVPLTSW